MNENEKKEFQRLQDIEKRQKARTKKNNDFIKNSYDRVSVLLPKGTKEAILEKGYSVNNLLNTLVSDFLKNN